MWEISVGNQFITFLYSLCIGGIFCAVYDILRAARKAGFNSFVAVFVTDILFWVVGAFVTFIFLIARTSGEIRGYVLISELVGFGLFRATFSRLIFPIFKIIFQGVQKLHTYFNIFFDALYLKTESILSKFLVFMTKFFKSTVKSIKKLLKNRRKVLYTNENNSDAEYVLDETKT